MLLGGPEAVGESVRAVVDPHLAVEAVEEANVARFVGDLRREEDALLLRRAGAHDRPQLVRDPLLADEEPRQPVHALEPLLGRDSLVPVDPVAAEVEVLGAPLLALPEQVELLVGEELRLAAVGRFLKRGVGGLDETLAVSDVAEGLGGLARGGARLAFGRRRLHGLALGPGFHFDLLSLLVRSGNRRSPAAIA